MSKDPFYQDNDMNTFFKKCLILLIAVVLPVSVCVAANNDGRMIREPVEVSADRLELDDNSGVLVFIGNAVAVQGDVTIYGDRLTVRYQQEVREVEQVVAEGNVRIVQGDRTATGRKAVFFRDEERVVLTGDPRVSQGDNCVSGQEITIFLNDRRSIVSGGSGGRVNAVFTPQTEKNP